MKTWTDPDVKVLDIEETANGGMPSKNFDQQWYDENGALHVNFVDPNANS